MSKVLIKELRPLFSKYYFLGSVCSLWQNDKLLADAIPRTVQPHIPSPDSDLVSPTL